MASSLLELSFFCDNKIMLKLMLHVGWIKYRALPMGWKLFALIAGIGVVYGIAEMFNLGHWVLAGILAGVAVMNLLTYRNVRQIDASKKENLSRSPSGGLRPDQLDCALVVDPSVMSQSVYLIPLANDESYHLPGAQSKLPADLKDVIGYMKKTGYQVRLLRSYNMASMANRGQDPFFDIKPGENPASGLMIPPQFLSFN